MSGTPGTEPLLPTQKDIRKAEKSLVHRAAVHLIESMDGVKRTPPLEDLKSRRQAYKFRMKYQPVFRIFATLSVLLTFFEPPQWCREMLYQGKYSCEDAQYPGFGLPLMHSEIHEKIEIMLLIPLIIGELLLWHGVGNAFFNKRRNKIRAAALFLTILDNIWAYALGGYWSFRLAPLFRIVIWVTYAGKVQSRLTLIFQKIFPQLIPTMFLVGCFIFMFAWAGVLLFPPDSPDSEGQLWFHGLGNAMWSLFVLFTTANFPDVMLPAYNKNRLVTILYFACFICIGIFILFNMVTALVFDAFTTQRDTQRQKRKELAHERQDEAFNTLAEIDGASHEVSITAIQDLLKELHHYEDVSFIGSVEQDEFVKQLDADGSGTISKEEFMTFMVTLKHSVKKPETRPPQLERWFPSLKSNSLWLSLKSYAMGEKKWIWDLIVDSLLLASVCLSFLGLCQQGLLNPGTPEEYKENYAVYHADLERSDIRSAAFWNTVLTFVFTFETTLKLTICGKDKFFHHFLNRYDFTVTWVCAIATSTVVFVPGGMEDPSRVRTVALLRVLRVMRLFLHINRTFRVLFKTFIKVMPDAIVILNVMLTSMYIFSLLGVTIYGGKINTDPANPNAKAIAETDFGTSDYYANNFNDMPSAMVVLFELLVVNNWFEIVDGFSASVSDMPYGNIWTPAFFLLWYIFGVVIILNIVIAFVLNNFVEQFEKGMIAIADKGMDKFEEELDEHDEDNEELVED